MTPARRILAWLAVAGSATSLAAACLDLTPIIYETGPDSSAPAQDAAIDVFVAGDDASDADVATDGEAAVADVDNRPPCVQCITSPDDAGTPGCADEIAACMADPECAGTYACALVNHCFEQPTFRDIVNCGIPCATEAGITNTNDPAIMLIYNIAVCAQARCNMPCHIGDAAIP